MKTTKQAAIEVIERLPDDASAEAIMAELYFTMKLEQARLDVREGRIVSQEDARRRFARWLESPGL